MIMSASDPLNDLLPLERLYGEVSCLGGTGVQEDFPECKLSRKCLKALVCSISATWVSSQDPFFASALTLDLQSIF